MYTCEHIPDAHECCVEQVDQEGEVATAFTLARILSNIPPSRGGPTSLVVFDIHALQVYSVSFCHHVHIFELMAAAVLLYLRAQIVSA